MSDSDVVRFYTGARKFPFFVGKLGDFRLPGGPYTLTQMLTAAAVIAVGKWSIGVWGSHMRPLVAWVVLLVIGVGAGVLVGRIPFGGRNPLLIAWGIVGYFDAPAWGTRRGREVRIGKTRRVKVRCSQRRDESSDAEVLPAPTATPHPTSVSLEDPVLDQPATTPEADLAAAPSSRRSVSPHQLTQIQQLLAASAQRR